MYYNQGGTLESTAIYFKNSDVLSTDIKSSTLLNDRSMTKYLYSNEGNDNKHLDSQDGTSVNEHGDDTSMNKHFNSKVKQQGNRASSSFPKIWRLDGTVQVLPKGGRHVGFYRKEYYWDNFPVEYLLPYSINQFKVYVNNTDYFMSNLPPLNITTNNKAEWNLIFNL